MARKKFEERDDYMTDEQLKEFGKRLEQTRTECKLTQKQIAERLNITSTTVCTAEKGKTKPSDIVLNGMCSILNVSKQWLLYGLGPKRIDVESDDELVDEVLDGNNEQIKAIIKGIVKAPGGWEGFREVVLSINKELEKLNASENAQNDQTDAD